MAQGEISKIQTDSNVIGVHLHETSGIGKSMGTTRSKVTMGTEGRGMGVLLIDAYLWDDKTFPK